MKFEYFNKWRLGIFLLSSDRDRAETRNFLFYQGWIVFAMTLFIIGVGGENIGIRAPYVKAFKIMTAIGFALALIPVISECVKELRQRIVNLSTAFTVVVIVFAFLLTLFYDF